jgi:signal transduction histidine kinase
MNVAELVPQITLHGRNRIGALEHTGAVDDGEAAPVQGQRHHADAPSDNFSWCEPRAGRQEGPATHLMPDVAKPIVFAVDDEEHITELIALGLSINGFDVVRLATGRDALAEIERRRPDLVVLDVMLPDLDGFEVARRLRQTEGAGTRVPIIFLTAKDATADKVQGLKLGVDDYVTKPFSIEELVERVRAVLRRSTGPLADMKEAFAEREENEQRLRRFLADASHELRTPLTSIQGFAELFRLGVDNEHIDQATIVRRIEDEAARMRSLVEDLLLLARLDLAPEPQHDPLDLAVLAADACSDAVAMAPERPVTLFAPDPVDVTGDVNHLRQAIANLVANAIRYTPSGTPIEVSARRQNGTAVISVRDHGPGLDPDGLEHVFERFWQADKARSGTGAGLGLAIVSAIATEHGGIAEAANAEGGGAVFSLRIPIPAAARPVEGRESHRDNSAGDPAGVTENLEQAPPE